MTGEGDEQDRKASDALVVIRGLAEDLVAARSEPYGTGREMWSAAMTGASGVESEREHCHALWLLWGALTDWVERKPTEKLQAEDAMRRAAKEWLEVFDDPSARRRYFDHWLYSEMAYERSI